MTALYAQTAADFSAATALANTALRLQDQAKLEGDTLQDLGYSGFVSGSTTQTVWQINEPIKTTGTAPQTTNGFLSVLTIGTLQSDGYVAGTTGWALKGDGSIDLATPRASIGYRGTAAIQSFSAATFTEANIQGTPDHDIGSGYTRSGNVVTIVNAGTYFLHGHVVYDGGWSGNARVTTRIETWTGSDPGVGAALEIANHEATAIPGVFNAANPMTQRTFAAGAKVRLIIWAGVAGQTEGNQPGQMNQLNIHRIA